MRLQRLAALQWVGLLLGAVTWIVAHLAGIGITQAECNAVGERWTLSNPWWQGSVMVVAGLLVGAAGLCAAVVFMQTRGVDFGDGPPEPSDKDDPKPGRIHFFSAAALAANVILLMIILLDGAANLADIACRQS